MVHAASRCKANLIKTFISQGDPRSQHSNSYLSTLFRTYVSQELPVDTIKKPSYFTGDFFTTIREVWGERKGELLYITTREWQRIFLERGITHVQDQHGTPVLIETDQEQKAPQISWAICWGMIRTRGLAPSQKSTLFNLAQNIMTNGERLFRTRLKESPDCGSCGEEPDDRNHMFTCPTFPKTSSGLQKLLNHITGKPFKMENLAILHIELEDPTCNSCSPSFWLKWLKT